MEYVSDGARLFYHLEGMGPTVVLLHPTPCDHHFWLPAAQSLTSKYQVIIPDLRGHGQSEAGGEPVPDPITVGRLAVDVVCLLDKLSVKRALFAGCSIGGYTLYEIWRQAPERVKALAFCCAKPQADDERMRSQREQAIARIREQGAGQFVDGQLVKLVGPTAQRRHPERMAEVRAMMERVRPATLIAVQQGLAVRPDSLETARGFRQPTFVLAGGEDPSSTPAAMKLLAETIRNSGYGAEYNELPDAGHFAPWEQPLAAGRLLRRFFDSV